MFSKIYTVNHIGDSDIQAQSIEELKQQKNYLKLLKKQGKELKELRKKHLKKVHTPTEWKHTFHQCRNITSFACMPQNKWGFFLPVYICRCGIWVRNRRVGVARLSLTPRGGAVRWRKTSNVASRKSKDGWVCGLYKDEKIWKKHK